MSSGYDTSCTTLSQEGRIYQIEYATKKIDIYKWKVRKKKKKIY